MRRRCLRRAQDLRTSALGRLSPPCNRPGSPRSQAPSLQAGHGRLDDALHKGLVRHARSAGLALHATQALWRDPERDRNGRGPRSEQLVDVRIKLLVGHLSERVDPAMGGLHRKYLLAARRPPTVASRADDWPGRPHRLLLLAAVLGSASRRFSTAASRA